MVCVCFSVISLGSLQVKINQGKKLSDLASLRFCVQPLSYPFRTKISWTTVLDISLLERT